MYLHLHLIHDFTGVACDHLLLLQELQLASSPARRRSSPFSSRLSRAGSQTGSTQSLAALSSTSHRARAEPSSPTSSLGRAAAHSPFSSQGEALRARGFHKSLSARATTDTQRFLSYAAGLRFPFSFSHHFLTCTPVTCTPVPCTPVPCTPGTCLFGT